MAIFVKCEGSLVLHVCTVRNVGEYFLGGITSLSLTVGAKEVPDRGNIFLIGALVVALVIYGNPGVYYLCAVSVYIVLVIVGSGDYDGVLCHVAVAVQVEPVGTALLPGVSYSVAVAVQIYPVFTLLLPVSSSSEGGHGCTDCEQCCCR